jgi:hypothetical protein
MLHALWFGSAWGMPRLGVVPQGVGTMITTAQELQVLRKLKDAEDCGVPASDIADMAELPASEAEYTLRRLVWQGLV